jgi:inner membrane protein
METIQHLPNTLLERFNRWLRESVTIKLFSIGFLILILLIPSSWIDDLVYERQQRAFSAMDEISGKWSGSQIISGPILVIPFKKHEIIDRGKEGKEIREFVQKAFFLPDQLDINGTVNPQILHRGIFDAVVYESSLNVNSVFARPDFKSLAIADDMVIWNEAYLVMGISDLRGISDTPTFTAGEKILTADPSNHIGVSVNQTGKPASNDSGSTQIAAPEISDTGILTRLPWENAESFSGNVSIKLSIKGSKRLDFIPAGKTTTVKLNGPWRDPSFDGEFLPAKREITEAGFNASWKILHFNRPFSQQWTENNQELSNADFGVNLLIPVDQYQKSMRTSKYSVLIILLTFMALFIVEITHKLRIHPFQYILIGAALIIYYILLLSLSEQVGYNIAYIIASLATVILISAYSSSFFNKTKLVILFSTLLLIFYTFIYVIILQQDFSLLIGSIGLFTIVGTLMYFSRKVKWYKEHEVVE